MFKRRTKPLPFNRMIPNILTMLSLCAGLTAIRFALMEKWEFAVASVLIAGVFDGLDGRVARMLRGTSKFGAELDSLSDFVSFGVAPAVVVYLWVMRDAGAIGWAFVLLFAVCSALRLARFNTMLEEDQPPVWAGNYFVGVSAPGAASIMFIPMALTFEIGPGYFDRPTVMAVFLVALALMMVSRVPTFSFKRFRVAPKFVLPMMLAIGLIAAFLVTHPWMTLSVVGIIYVLSIPLAIRSYGKRKRAESAED